MIQSIYDDMWEKFKSASEQNKYELDPYLLDPHSDTRRGITALAYLNQNQSAALDEIVKFQNAVKAIEPQQYYHPLNELHLTLLSVISCMAGFQLSEINTETYAEIFASVVRDIHPIEIQYQGISASPNCILIQGFPIGDELEKLRNTLRTKLKAAGLRVSFDSRYTLVTAHSSVIRFRTPISNSKQLLALCHQYRNHSFGHIVLSDFELVFNNWYQNLSITQSLSRCSVLSQTRV